MSKSSDPSGKSQSDKFKDAAREIGADEDEAQWEERLRKIVIRNPKIDEAMPEDVPPAKR